MDVAQFFDPDYLRLAYTVGPQIAFDGREAMYPEILDEISRRPASILHFRCTHDYLQNPVVIQPPAALCRILAHTELAVAPEHYRQPWPILGIAWPPDAGPLPFSLVWTPPVVAHPLPAAPAGDSAA
jgi:hypothetical protein